MRIWDNWIKTHHAKYPSEDFIRFVAKYYYAVQVPYRRNVRFLEIGCGAGRHCFYLDAEGFTAIGIDSSEEAIRLAKERRHGKGLPRFDCSENLNWFDIDCIVDNKCLTHNSKTKAKRIIQQAYARLKPGGLFYSRTFERISPELLHGLKVRLTARKEIESLYAPFTIESVYRLQEFKDGLVNCELVIIGRKV